MSDSNAEPLQADAGATRPDDATLGGYLSVHNRPPAYEASDGHPYTVSIEVEHTANLRAPHSGFLVFPRWAETGVGIIGHVETDILVEAATEAEARAEIGALSLLRVQELLEEALVRQRAIHGDGEWGPDE